VTPDDRTALSRARARGWIEGSSLAALQAWADECWCERRPFVSVSYTPSAATIYLQAHREFPPAALPTFRAAFLGARVTPNSIRWTFPLGVNVVNRVRKLVTVVTGAAPPRRKAAPPFTVHKGKYPGPAPEFD
jgi:hypothetical protein